MAERIHARRDFHAERLRERSRWKGLLLFLFLLVGASAALALFSLLSR